MIAGIAIMPSITRITTFVHGAQVAADKADRQSDHRGERRDRQADDERDAAAVDDAAVQVAPEPIRAEPVLGGGAPQALRLD
jgi:hypothetical protein